MHDTVLNCVLERQHVQVEDFSHHGQYDLQQAEYVRDFIAILNKHRRMLIRQFHDVHSLRHFRINDKVKRHDTGKFNDEKWKV